MDGSNASGPIETINLLLYDWLTLATTDVIHLPRNREHLFIAFELVNFLAKAYEQVEAVRGLTEQEVNRG